MPVRAVAFDIGGVLEVPTDIDLADRWERRLGLRRGELFGRLRRSGLGRDANLGRVSAAGFALALGRLYGLDRPTTEELLAELWDWYVGELNTGMAAYFQGLRPRYRTAILSNAAEGGRREEERRYGFASMADVLVYSYEVGIEKPDRRIYEIACERLGVHPSEVVFLDDLEAIVAAARHGLGYAAVVLGLGRLLPEGSSLVVAAATWPWPPPSSRPAAASSRPSTGASTAAATTPARPSPGSAPARASRST